MHAFDVRAPGDAFTLYRLLRGELREKIVGQPELTSRLALLGTLHMAGLPCSVTLIGPSGTGKTSAVRALAESLALPLVEISIPQMAEPTFQGTDIADQLGALLDRARSMSPTDAEAAELAARAVVLLDDFSHLRLSPPSASAATRDHRLGQQLGLLSIIDRGTLAVERRGQTLQWSARDLFIAVAGTFDQLEAARPSAGDLVAWGLLPELAERLAKGLVLRVEPVTGSAMATVLSCQLDPVRLSFRTFGFRLEVAEETLTFAAAQLESGSFEAGPRTAAGWLAEAAWHRLLHLVAAQAPPGTTAVLSPDDLSLPAPPRWKWRE